LLCCGKALGQNEAAVVGDVEQLVRVAGDAVGELEAGDTLKECAVAGIGGWEEASL
jgi:tRNA A22 N-methylase